MSILSLSTSVLWNYKEFDRNKNPSPLGINCVPLMAETMKREGMKEPIELTVFGNKCLVTNGNYRLAAAIYLGWKSIAVRIVFLGEDDIHRTYYDFTILRFKEIGRDLSHTINSLRYGKKDKQDITTRKETSLSPGRVVGGWYSRVLEYARAQN